MLPQTLDLEQYRAMGVAPGVDDCVVGDCASAHAEAGED